MKLIILIIFLIAISSIILVYINPQTFTTGQSTSDLIGSWFNKKEVKIDDRKVSINEEDSKNLKFKMKAAPLVRVSQTLRSIGTSLITAAEDLDGNKVEQLNKSFKITIDFNKDDLTAFKQDTIAIYFSNDGINWSKLETEVNFREKIAYTNYNRFGHYALIAERIDTVAPMTTLTINGSVHKDNQSYSKAELMLISKDNEGGLGIDYILYKIDDQDWQEYKSPITIEEYGEHTIDFYSVDKDENIEEVKTGSFIIQ